MMKEIENGVRWPCFSSKYSPRGRGISKIKKKDINEKLCPLMPPEKSKFWENLDCCSGDDSEIED